MIKKLLLILSILLIFSCGEAQNTNTPRESPITPPISNTPTPTSTLTPQEQKIDDLKKKLDESDKKIALLSNGNIVDKLTAEKDSLGLRIQLSEAYSTQWKLNAESYNSQKKEKEQELKDAKLESWKEKLWWMAGICGFVAIVAGGISIGFPLLRPIAIKASIIVGAIATIMLIVAQCISTIAWLLGLVPYILALGAISVIVYSIVALLHWWKDHNGLVQTVEGIEPIKAQVPNFKDHMLKYVDGGLVKHVKKIRTKIKQ